MPLDPFLNQSQDRGEGVLMPSLKAGQRLFNLRYELLRPLGAGGMGVVWLARDHTEENDVALKFLPTVLVLQEGEMRRLREEVRAGKELRHPRLVATYGMEIEEGIAAIVMEYVNGQTLSQKLEAQERGFFEPEEIRGWIKDMTDGLGYLHDEARRIHRDLKPANVIIDADGRAKLMDFGISHRIKEGVSRHSKTSDSQAGGSSSTLAYASPQQITGKPSSKADDIYSLGATIYELLTGTPPFFRGGIDAVRGQIKDEPATPIMERRSELVDEGMNRDAGKTVGKEVEQAVMACLAKEREKRPASCVVIWQAISAPASPHAGATAKPSEDAEARKRAALDEKRREEELQMAEERKRARAAQQSPTEPAKASSAASASSAAPVPESVYAEYLGTGAINWSQLSLAYLPVSPRGAWQDRTSEAEEIAQQMGLGSRGAQACSSVVASVAFVGRHSFVQGNMLCCEVRPDHICCSWLEIGDGIFEELGSWAIDRADISDDRLAARVWSSCEGMRSHTMRDPRQIECCAVTHSCSSTRDCARGLSANLPGKVWLWEDEVPAAIIGAQTGLQQNDTLLLLATPYVLSVRLPDQTLLPVLNRFTTIPTRQSVEASWKQERRGDAMRIELVEETDRGVVPIKSQAVASSACSTQNGITRTRIEVDVEARWRVSLKLDAPPVVHTPPPPVTKPAGATSPKQAESPIPPQSTPPVPPPKSAPQPVPDVGFNPATTILTVILIAVSFAIALAAWPDADNVAHWRNGSWVLLFLMVLACGSSEKHGKAIAERLVGPVVVTLLAALIFTGAAWLWPHKPAKDASERLRGVSGSKVFTLPESEPPKN
ncbi:MAG: serine/threonine-protein kinase [Verrucomicrobiaceae bacterium]